MADKKGSRLHNRMYNIVHTVFGLPTLSTKFLSYPQNKTVVLSWSMLGYNYINSYGKISICVYLVERIGFRGISAGKFKLMNNLIQYYDILWIGIGICLFLLLI